MSKQTTDIQKRENISAPVLGTTKKQRVNKSTRTFFDDLRWDWCITAGDIFRDSLFNKILPPRDDIKCDRLEFLNLLTWSLSLTTKEKERIKKAWPELTQSQCDDLRIVYLDERMEFVALIDKERSTILKMLFQAAESCAQLVYGDSKTAESAIIDALYYEITGVKSLPFDKTFFPRNAEFFGLVASTLLTIGASPEISQCALEMAQKKHKDEDDPRDFFEVMLEILPTTGSTIEKTRNVLRACIDMRNQMLVRSSKRDGLRCKLLAYHASNLVDLKDHEQALTCLSEAYKLSKLNPEKPEVTIYVLKKISDVRAFSFPFLDSLDGPKCIFTDQEWADITPEVYERIRPLIAYLYFTLGHARLSFELYQEHIEKHTEQALEAFSVGLYLGDDRVGHLLKLYVTETQSTLDRLLKDAEEQHTRNRSDKHMIECADQAFSLWLRFMSMPDATTKAALDRIYNNDYARWFNIASLLSANNLSWDEVHLARLFQRLSDGLPLQTDALIASVRTTHDRLFLLDNLYLVAGLFQSRGDKYKARQLAQVAKEIYALKEDQLLGQNIAFTEKFREFAERCDGASPVFAGEPTEVAKFEGTWTLEQFKQILMSQK